MRVILASSNKGKIQEIQKLLGVEVVPYKDILGELEIVEDGESFKENAIIKAKAIYERLPDEIVIADDSGISVPALGGEPGIYSARYAGVGASDKENLQKLISKLKEKGLERTPAYYTAAIAIASGSGIYTTHGWMWGEVIDEARGDKGFGYDPMFIPEGYDKTLGELDEDVKKRISHRAKALELAKVVLEKIK
ncbi:MAG: non-canonical purine NTP pyrophosphatase, RdgB/HAM1 family [Epsilonproteobacteria bacterium]|nr:non-canonical purine NTP pyrophosphatase, RdgB/HAM1 family [Campylobacterota bacterium]NPA63766.1 RdgB/HAM1 family non-canonical purine NTP pyrophosphatase [Campylobacterota bacterium]